MKSKGAIEDLKIKKIKKIVKIVKIYLGLSLVMGSVGSVHFRIVPWSGL